MSGYPIDTEGDCAMHSEKCPDCLWIGGFHQATCKNRKPSLPTDAKERKSLPIGRGFFDYFPNAIAEVARVSKAGNDQHNPGQEMHWARGKSTDQIDTILRHLMERGNMDSDGMRHTAKAAWRVMALLQLEMEASGAPIARGAKE